jgi:hypothetical protein
MPSVIDTDQQSVIHKVDEVWEKPSDGRTLLFLLRYFIVTESLIKMMCLVKILEIQ